MINHLDFCPYGFEALCPDSFVGEIEPGVGIMNVSRNVIVIKRKVNLRNTRNLEIEKEHSRHPQIEEKTLKITRN